jgi:hypothetical protein
MMRVTIVGMVWSVRMVGKAWRRKRAKIVGMFWSTRTGGRAWKRKRAKIVRTVGRAWMRMALANVVQGGVQPVALARILLVTVAFTAVLGRGNGRGNGRPCPYFVPKHQCKT